MNDSSRVQQRDIPEYGSIVDVAVVIATKDRPALLDEAISSAMSQTHPAAEIIIVDDRSVPAVDAVTLRNRYGPIVRVSHNERSLGLAYSRTRGVQEAVAQYVIHLDDDDRLDARAIEKCVALMQVEPDIEWIMLGTQGFGPKADHFNSNQSSAVSRVVKESGGVEIRPNTFIFDQQLFPALLRAVPIAFQRAMLKRRVWTAISELRWSSYCLDPKVPDWEAAKTRINGYLRDSEWAWYASMYCRKTALIDEALYHQRCAGQGYSSRPENKQIHSDQFVEMMEFLTRGASHLESMKVWKPQIRTALSRAYFDRSYGYCETGDYLKSWSQLALAARTSPSLKQLRLAARIAVNAIGMCTRHRSD